MSLVPRLLLGSLDLTDYPYSLEFGRDFGAPENIYTILTAQLADGEPVASDRSSNRTLTFSVLVEGSDLLELADAERALIAECDKAANVLSFDPGDGIAPVTVFETFRAQPTPVNDDDMESALVRRYSLSIPALPFPRSADQIIDDADAPPASGGTVLDALDSATGWARVYGSGTAPAVDGTLFHQGTGCVAIDAGVYNLTGTDAYGNPVAFGLSIDDFSGLALSTSTGGYLSIWVRLDFTSTIYDNYGQQVPSLLRQWHIDYGSGFPAGDGVAFFAAETAADGFVRYVTQVAASQTIAAMRFESQQYRWGHAASIPKVRYDAVSLSTTATTDSQITKTFTVEGSVRAPGSLHVASPDDAVALGSVLVATIHEDDIKPGFRPDVRRWVTAGSTTVDATALHGSYYSPGSSYSSGVQFEAPASQYVPGNYSAVVLAKVTSGSPATIGVETQLTFAGAAAGSASDSDATYTPGATGWALVPVGTVRIPEVTNPGTDAEIRVRVKSDVPVDDIFLLPEAADFTIAECGTSAVSGSGSASHLWIDSPDPTQPMGGWWRGPAGDGSNRRKLSRVSELTRPGRHVFKPGTNVCWCVATNADGPSVALSHFPHWHSNAAL